MLFWPMSDLKRRLLQKSFCVTEYKFSGPHARRSNNYLRDHISSNKTHGRLRVMAWRLVRSLGDCGSFGLFRGNRSHDILGVLQHYQAHYGLRSGIARGPKSANSVVQAITATFTRARSPSGSASARTEQMRCD